MRPKNLEQEEEPAASKAELALFRFTRFYDEGSRDHDYDAFFDNDKNYILQNIGTKFFNWCLMFQEVKKYSSLYYIVVHQDIRQADFYYESLKEQDQEEINDLLVQSLINNKGEIKIELLFSMIKRSKSYEESWQGSKLISRLLSEDKLSDPRIQFHIGIKSITQLDYENGIHFLNLSASQNYDPAIFYQALLTFHGYHCEKEQIESLERMIVVGRRLKWRYAFEVAMILLQGVDIEQNIEEGLEMLRCAESGYEIPQLIREGLYHVKVPSLYYDLLDAELDFYNDNKENEANQNRIWKNPKYRFNALKSHNPSNIFQYDKDKLESVIEKDYLEAEFFFSLVTSTEEMCDHLLRGAKGGCIESQIFLGLQLIYCSELENKKQEGIYWLTVAASQNNQLAIEILVDLYTHGYRGISIDNEKANDYRNSLKTSTRMNFDEISTLLTIEVDKFIENCDLSILRILARYNEEMLF